MSRTILSMQCPERCLPDINYFVTQWTVQSLSYFLVQEHFLTRAFLFATPSLQWNLRRSLADIVESSDISKLRIFPSNVSGTYKGTCVDSDLLAPGGNTSSGNARRSFLLLIAHHRIVLFVCADCRIVWAPGINIRDYVHCGVMGGGRQYVDLAVSRLETQLRQHYLPAQNRSHSPS